MGPDWLNWPVANKISDRLISTTTVRIKVARSELMSSTPILAKIAVSAANPAESRAQTNQDGYVSGLMRPRSIPVVRQHRQRGDLDAFVDQRSRFVGRGLAVDRTMLDIAVMHLARLVRKAFAD